MAVPDVPWVSHRVREGVNAGSVTPGDSVNPGERWLHVSQTVKQPCKLLPSWHKVPLIWKISKQHLPVVVELDDGVVARADWLQHYIVWKDRSITSVCSDQKPFPSPTAWPDKERLTGVARPFQAVQQSKDAAMMINQSKIECDDMLRQVIHPGGICENLTPSKQ